MRRVAFVILWLFAPIACSSPSTPPQPPASAGSSTSGSSTTQVTGKASPGALVMLEPVSGAVPLPAGGAVMDQFSKAFVPETLFVRVGQPVTFKNSEDQLHNVTVVRSRTGTRVMNISQNQGDVHNYTFEQPGEYAVSCDVHPGMQATIVAAKTPHATYADGRGTFAFQNVPPGEYRLQIAVDGRDSERTVTIAGAAVDLSVTSSR